MTNKNRKRRTKKKLKLSETTIEVVNDNSENFGDSLVEKNQYTYLYLVSFNLL